MKYPETPEEIEAFTSRYIALRAQVAPVLAEITDMEYFIDGFSASSRGPVKLTFISKHEHALRHWNSPFHDLLTEEELADRELIKPKKRDLLG
jgi:hypothetical protein